MKMNKTGISQLLFLALWVLFLFFSVIQTNTFKHILTGKAQATNLTIKVALQGNFDQAKNPSYKTRIAFYTREAKVKELTDQILSFDQQNKFKLTLNLNDMDLTKMYAITVKPDKYFGKIFCSANLSSANCTSPQIILKNGDDYLDLTTTTFLSGDLNSQDGKVDSYDLSKIIADIGKTTNNYLETDINSDLIVNAVDYSLALYSLAKNTVDDTVNFGQGTPTPTPTPTPFQIQPSNTPSPTANPSLPTSTPVQATLTPLPPTNIPTNTPIPTATITPTPTQTVSQGGTCYVTLNGKIYANAGIFGSHCRKINNEKHSGCTLTQSDCNPNKCIEELKIALKERLSACSNGIATLDEQKTQITCSTEFISSSCTPEPTPACEDNREKC